MERPGRQATASLSSTRRESAARDSESGARSPATGLMKDVRFISELIDTLEASYNIDSDPDLRQRAFQWRRHVVRAFLHAVRSDRGGRDGGARRKHCRGAGARTDEPVPMIAFHGTADPDDSVQRRCVVDIAPSRFRACRDGRRIGREETGAQPIPSNRWSRRMSRVAHTRNALTTRPWCSTPFGEEAIPGPAARRCRNGSSVDHDTASTPRA